MTPLWFQLSLQFCILISTYTILIVIRILYVDIRIQNFKNTEKQQVTPVMLIELTIRMKLKFRERSLKITLLFISPMNIKSIKEPPFEVY